MHDSRANSSEHMHNENLRWQIQSLSHESALQSLIARKPFSCMMVSIHMSHHADRSERHSTLVSPGTYEVVSEVISKLT